jgi:hypothetical protein
MRSSLQLAQDELIRARTEAAQADEQHSLALQRYRAEAEREVADLLKERDAHRLSTREEHADLQIQLDGARQSLEEARARLAIREDDARMLQAAKDELSSQLDAAHAKTAEVEDRLNAQLDHARKQQATAQVTSSVGDSEARSALARAQDEASTARDALEAMRSKLETARAAEYATAAEHAEGLRRLTDAELAGATYAQIAEETQAALQRALSEADILHQRADASAAELRTAQGAAARERATVVSLRDALEKVHSARSRAAIEADKQARDAAQARQRADDLAVKMRLLEVEIEKLRTPKLWEPALPPDELSAAPTAETLRARVAALRQRDLPSTQTPSPKPSSSDVESRELRSEVERLEVENTTLRGDIAHFAEVSSG